jgi:UDP-2,3-diacylglucosamine pyrophosphatase LpxH
MTAGAPRTMHDEASVPPTISTLDDVAAPPAVRESLLVFSDVHLGSDLNDHGTSPPRSALIDRDLVRLLRHYAATERAGDRWRVVIAGDFIDFIGMTVKGHEGALTTELTPEERAHGLGSASDHARIKLERVFARHGDVFDALADLVARGHALTLVHGNHDVDFHWDDVKADFRAGLLSRARRAGGACDETDDDAAFLARIEFEPWFFYWKDIAYIEHGHQYDAYCASDHVMAPLSPLDPRRVMRGFSSTLLRYVVRQTHGMKEHGHENLGVYDYLAFGAKLGVRGIAGLVSRFSSAVVELFALRRAHFSEAMHTLRAEHERRVALLAEATRLGIDRLRALAALQVPPVTRSIPGILRSVLLDRLALGLFASLALLTLAIVGVFHGKMLYGALGVLGAWALAHRYLSQQRQLDPADEMLNRAGTLARLLPAAFVVMGHTHIPSEQSVSGGDATYINLGSWAEEEELGETSGHAPYRAARTHLVIELEGGLPKAELRAWCEDRPAKYEKAGA